MNAKMWMAAVVGVCAGIGTAGADVVTMGASRDNTLFQTATGNTSNGAGDGIFVGMNNLASPRRGVIHFDVAATVPAGATITGVTLTLHLNSAGSATPGLVELHRLLADWGEGTSVSGGGNGAASQPGDATWVHRFFGSSNLWTTPGGDFAAGVSGTAPIATALTFYSVSGAGMIADVQAWLDGSLPNFGWIMLGNETASQSVRRFESSEHATEALRPSLTVEYTIPSPGAAVVLGMGAVAGMRRRR